MSPSIEQGGQEWILKKHYKLQDLVFIVKLHDDETIMWGFLLLLLLLFAKVKSTPSPGLRLEFDNKGKSYLPISYWNACTHSTMIVSTVIHMVNNKLIHTSTSKIWYQNIYQWHIKYQEWWYSFSPFLQLLRIFLVGISVVWRPESPLKMRLLRLQR